MHRGSHYHGRIVISLSTGSMVGRVRRVVADLDHACLGGLLVQPEGAGGAWGLALYALPFLAALRGRRYTRTSRSRSSAPRA